MRHGVFIPPSKPPQDEILQKLRRGCLPRVLAAQNPPQLYAARGKGNARVHCRRIAGCTVRISNYSILRTALEMHFRAATFGAVGDCVMASLTVEVLVICVLQTIPGCAGSRSEGDVG